MWSQLKPRSHFLFGMIGMTKHNHQKPPFPQKSLQMEFPRSLPIWFLTKFYNYRLRFALSKAVKIIKIASLSIDIEIFKKPPHTTRSESLFLVP